LRKQIVTVVARSRRGVAPDTESATHPAR
jgi:hypothetical protein